MAKHRNNVSQLTLDFGLASIPATPAATDASMAHAILPPVSPSGTAKSPLSSLPTPEIERVIPVPPPLESAVRKGVFGFDENDEPIEPSADEVHEISGQHAARLAELFVSLEHVDELLANKQCGGRNRLIREKERLTCQVQGTLAVYAEDFGETAARHLESWARADACRADSHDDSPLAALEASTSPAAEPRYGPGHPWHYLSRGDGQKPSPVDSIPVAASDGEFAGKLPRDARKRRARLSQLLEDQTRQLEDDRARYKDILERGALALSEYDRSIAYGGDLGLAVASSLALKFNHISNGLGRVKWLRRKLGLQDSAFTSTSIESTDVSGRLSDDLAD